MKFAERRLRGSEEEAFRTVSIGFVQCLSFSVWVLGPLKEGGRDKGQRRVERRDKGSCQGLESFFRKKEEGAKFSCEKLRKIGIEKLLSDLLLKKGEILGRMSRYVKD